MDKRAFDKWIASLTTVERVTKAREKLPKLVDHVLNLIALHANNEIITYSPKLSEQIPQSFAANAFNVTQMALHRFELVRICAIWDSADPDKENIATIVGLVDDADVGKVVTDETANHWMQEPNYISNPSEDPALRELERQALRDADAHFGREQADRDLVWIAEALSEAKDVLASEKLQATMNLRDKHLAHLLTITKREKQGVVHPMKYGYERHLLEAAIRITDKLYCAVTGTGFAFDESWRIARKNANELWDACKFTF